MRQYISNIKSTRSFYKANLILAFPVILSHAGQMVVVLADNLMVGRLGATQLAAAALANNIFIIGMVFGIGIVTGITPLAGKAIGGGNRLEAVNWLKQSVVVFPPLIIVQVMIMSGAVLILPHIGQPNDVVKLAIPYYLTLVASIIPFQMFFLVKQYTEGLGNTRIAMIITLTSNALNIFLNYILIYGKLGFPAYGLIGAGYATFIARAIMPVIFCVFILKLSFFEAERVLWKKCKFQTKKAIKVLKLGLPMGGQSVVDISTFSLGSIMMGWIGTNALAAHQIVISLVSFTYMISAGMAAATTIKVSHFRGLKYLFGIKKSTQASLHIIVTFMTLSLIAFLLFRFRIPSLFVPDHEVIVIAASLMLVGGLFQIFDGIQVITLGALRGLEDVNIPMGMLIISNYLIAMPVSYFSAFTFNLGPQGIWLGYMTGLFLISVMLQIRFKWKIKMYGNSNEFNQSRSLPDSI